MDLQEAFDAGFEAVKAYVDAEIRSLAARIKAIEDMPAPPAGRDGRDGKNGEKGEAGGNGRDGADGKDGADGRDGAPGEPGRNGKDGADGRDGVGLAGAVQSKDGHLILTMTSGATVDVGNIAGRDGQDGRDGADGQPGRDGVDGLGFDDMVVEYDGERGIVLRFARGEQIKEFAFTMPVVIDRGVWLEGKEYAAGDAVTWGGSLWIAQKDVPAGKPDGGEGWRLAVKRGRDGKPGKDGELKFHQPVKVS